MITPPDPDVSDINIKTWRGSGDDGGYAIQLTGINYPVPKCVKSFDTADDPNTSTRYIGFTVHATDREVPETIEVGVKSIEVLELDNISLIQIPYVEANQVMLEDLDDPEALAQRDDLFSHEGNPYNLPTTKMFDNPRREEEIGAFSVNKYLRARGAIRVVNTYNAETICTIDEAPAPDPNPPECCYHMTMDGDQVVIEVKAWDKETGITKIHFDFLRNVLIEIPDHPARIVEPKHKEELVSKTEFDEGDTGTTAEFDARPIVEPETITLKARRDDPSKKATAVVYLFDGNEPTPNRSENCDPRIFNINISPKRYVKRETISGLTERDHFVTILNREPGLNLLALKANDGRFHARRLADNEVARVDTGADMVPGENDMHFVALGHPGDEATVIISDLFLNLEAPASSSESPPLFQPRRRMQECKDNQ